MALPSLKTPNVYIHEVNAFPNSVVAVDTAIPAFIGYTRRADYKGKDYLNRTVEINSLNEFLTFFGAMAKGPAGGVAPDDEQYAPVYHARVVESGGDLTLGGRPVAVQPDPRTIYHLYNSIKLFYENGGGKAFVVSVGLIADVTGDPPVVSPGPIVNDRVKGPELQAGLRIGGDEPQVTMIVIPDAVLLTRGEYAALTTAMLAQCGDQGSRVAIIDVYGGDNPDPSTLAADVIEPFRTAVGMNNLHYGAAYFPFLRTTIVPTAAVNFDNLGGGKELAAVLPGTDGDKPPAVALRAILSGIQNLQNPPAADAPTALQLENALRAASPEYGQLHDLVLTKINTLPPSGAMAGVYAAVDKSRGVWQAPANVTLAGVTDVTLKVTDASQAPLNVDAVTGKSINAIRLFPGFGVTVWGARTLDGNSQDWRYVNVRRTVIMIEESIRLALRAYVFAPNVASTWSLIQSMLTSFLTGVWNQGGLAGTTAAAAFDVAVGLGVTMTPDDVLDGILRVTVRVAVTHPAEFIVVTVSQKQQS